MKTKDKIGVRMWLFVVLIGFAGQLAWSIENMYLNTYITYLNFSAPAGESFNYSLMIAITTALSAIVATLTTIFMGVLTDKVGHKRHFISFGYILWGLATAAFGIFNVNSTSQLIPIAMVSSMAAIWVIILDCMMTFFGSTANDAAFNSYVTKNISGNHKGKVEGVLQILPLVAMLLIFVVLNGFTTDSAVGVHDAKWDLFFYLIGGLVLLMGILSFFLIPPEEESKDNTSYVKQLVEGFKPSTVKKNKELYVVLLIYFVYATATQVFFPYLMVYMERTCQIANVGTGFLTPFAIVMAIALIAGSLLSLGIGSFADTIGKNNMIIPTFVIYGIGILMMFFIPYIGNAGDTGRTVYAAISGMIMILGYVGVPTIVNALVREKIPKGKEGNFMGIRMLFVVALPMCIGPFIGNALNGSLGQQYTTTYGDVSFVPTEYGYLIGLAFLVLAIIPILIYSRMRKNDHFNHGYLFSKRDEIHIDPKEVPLSEYPRPNLKRESYLNLDGIWDFCISKSEELPSVYRDYIMVPYAIESAYSGINHLMEVDEILYYRKKVKLPDGFKKQKTIIHFEGVDQYCEVYINDVMVASHMGGFTPFDAILPSDIDNEFTITLKVKDWTDDSYHTRGKQALQVTGYFYSSSSGVYKPIWMESVQEDYIQNVIFTPNYDKQTLKVKVVTPTDGKAKLVIHAKEYEVQTNVEETISLSHDFHAWNNKDPYLYDVDIWYKNDVVSSYFGIRKIEIKEINGKKRILLNNEPIFFSGLLDQGYYFIGNYTPKNYEEYLFDIKKCKEMGFNCLRKHIKTELPLFYYYCDKEGMLLIQDFPCGGDKYSFLWSVIARPLPFLDEKNINYKRMARTSKEGRDEFEHECSEYLSLYHNYPSILIYTIFNEGWGEFDPSRIYHSLKGQDELHLFDTASGWYDADSDFYSIHTYTSPDMKRIDKKNRPFIISEMGGMSLAIEDHSYFDGFFGHGSAKDMTDLENQYVKLYREKMLPQIEKYGLNMAIYTEVADCETEYNGIFTYDRKVQKIKTETLYKINEELYQELLRCTK